VLSPRTVQPILHATPCRTIVLQHTQQVNCFVSCWALTYLLQYVSHFQQATLQCKILYVFKGTSCMAVTYFRFYV
jgi:hypothetical protein